MANSTKPSTGGRQLDKEDDIIGRSPSKRRRSGSGPEWIPTAASVSDPGSEGFGAFPTIHEWLTSRKTGSSSSAQINIPSSVSGRLSYRKLGLVVSVHVPKNLPRVSSKI